MRTDARKMYGFSIQAPCLSGLTSRSGETRIHITRHGRYTSRLAKASIWLAHYGAVNRCFISGESSRENALSAAIPSHARPDGTTITSSPGCWAALPAPPTVSSFTPNVTANCTVVSVASTHRVSHLRRYEGLSRVSWKLSRTVLRGVSGGNAARLLDAHLDNKTKKPYDPCLQARHLVASRGAENGLLQTAQILPASIPAQDSGEWHRASPAPGAGGRWAGRS